MTKDRRFKNRVRRRIRATGETYAAALEAEKKTRPPPREPTIDTHPDKKEGIPMGTKPAVATRLRGIWLGVTDVERSREFYEELGAYFHDEESSDGIFYATLGGARLIFETVPEKAGSASGPYLLFDVTDADGLFRELESHGREIVMAPKNELWGRQLNVLDPDGHSIAFVGPRR
ncbi:MAG: VOC family protein [Actinobacteria bacterium]|nr:VOC family protein [Actinomycetota bacterium]